MPTLADFVTHEPSILRTCRTLLSQIYFKIIETIVKMVLMCFKHHAVI